MGNSESLEAPLRDSVLEGKFMPFLGAGASSLRPTDRRSAPWNKVSARVVKLLGSLEDEGEKKYLRTQAQAHDIDMTKQTGDLVYRPQIANDLLFQLQKSLVRLGSRLVELFGQEMVRGRHCVAELVEYQVDVTSSDRAALLELWLDADDAAAELVHALRTNSQQVEEETEILGARSIYEKLLLFTCRMRVRKGKELPSLARRLAKHQKNLQDLDLLICSSLRPTLRLDELAWLEDLLWHTLRYDIPAYPTVAELTFRLSLTAATALVHRGELTQVAELLDEKALEATIKQWIRFCEVRTPSLRRFHLSIAAALLCEYSCYDKEAEIPRVPVAFTTNYDQAIEKALDRLAHSGDTYHVVFPVYVTLGASKKSNTSPTWVGYSVRFKSDGSRSESELFNCRDWTIGFLQDFIKGPIIVKLHGSPLVDLPANPNVQEVLDDGKLISYKEIKHMIILSESSYLRAIVEQRKYPKWIEETLKAPNRDLWFLGYSISDWNVRLRLFEHLLYTREISEEDQPTKSLYGHGFDLLRAAIFDTLHIEVHEGGLGTFAAHLRRVPQIGDRVESVMPPGS